MAQLYPSPDEPTSEEKTLAAIGHFGSLMFVFLVPLIIFLIQQDSKFVRRQMASALWFNLWVFLIGIVLLIFGIITLGIGLILFPVLGLAYAVFVIVAGVKAVIGENYYYPLTKAMPGVVD